MGYALFTARKLNLTTRVNQLNAQLMSISQQQMDLANQQSAYESAYSLRSATAYSQLASDYAAGTIDEKAFEAGKAQQSVFSTQSDAQIQALASKQNALDIQRESLETQLNAAQSDLESVEKAEGDAIKNATPGYVG